MKITSKNNAIYIKKPDGPEVWYYLFPEYEVHYNIQPPQSGQAWHRHEKLDEALYIIEGEMVALWQEGDKKAEKVVRAGDLIQVEKSDHTFENRSDKPSKFLVIKQVLTDEDKSKVLKEDKIVIKKYEN